MHRQGHVGITLLLYAPVILLASRFAEWAFPLAVFGAVLLADLLLPITAMLSLLSGRRYRASFSLAMLPDIDMNLPGVKHRGITHTVWFALAVGAVAAVAGFLLTANIAGLTPSSEGRLVILGAGFFGYLGFHAVVTHLLGDVITPAGIRPFAPVRDSEYSLGLVKAANTPANVLLYFCGLGAVGAAVVLAL